MPTKLEVKDCPMCGARKSLRTTVTKEPVDSVNGICFYCGYSYETNEYQLTLDEVNDKRMVYGLPLIGSLIPQLRKPHGADYKEIGMCNKCGRVYADEDSVATIKSMLKDGYAPCPIVSCVGSLEIRREKKLGA